LNRHILVPDEDILWVISVLAFAFAWTRRIRASVVYASGPPYSSLLLGYLIARSRRLPLVVDMRDDWRENAVRKEKPRYVLTLEMALERLILGYAARTLVPTQRGVESILRRHPACTPERVVHVPNGFDQSEFARIRQILLKEEKDRFHIVCASGGLSPEYRDLHPFLAALAKVRGRKTPGSDRLRVLFLGTDVLSHYGQDIRELDLEQCIHTRDDLSRAEYIHFLLQADALLLVQMDNAPSSIPGTLYEYVATGDKPIILIGGLGATKDMVERHSLGYACGVDDVEGIAAAIAELCDDWVRGFPKRRSSTLDIRVFDRRQIAVQFCDILDAAVGSVTPEKRCDDSKSVQAPR
jgi:glycosyltransferase involved in cell wall biosynthesis